MKTSPLMIEMDVDKMARVFNNLISNALKYAHGGTWVHIEAEKIGSEVIASVKNNGEHIPEESLQSCSGAFIGGKFPFEGDWGNRAWIGYGGNARVELEDNLYLKPGILANQRGTSHSD